MEHTKKVASFVAETRYEIIPPKAVEVAIAAGRPRKPYDRQARD